MHPPIRIALVGDHDPSVPAHVAIPLALDLAAAHHSIPLQAEWIATTAIHHAPHTLAPFAGIWCVPASPYRNTEGALDAIRFARENSIPFLGTCGGFQHALIEYAQNVLHLDSAAHAETDPHSPNPLISRLSCSLVEQAGELVFEPGSRIAQSYGSLTARESYRCNYGPNPALEAELFAGPLRVTARDPDREVRAAELHGHPFFLGALFQPERRALQNHLPPLVRDFVAALL